MNINDRFWRDKCVLVTGHTGFMGGWLTVMLKEMGAKVIGYALAPPTEPCFFDAVGLARLLDADFRGDIRERTTFADVIRERRPEIMFHLAAQPLVLNAFRDPVDTFDVNVMGTVSVLEAARNAPNLRSVVVVTTDKVYDNVEWEWEFRENDRLGGREPYGVSKACAELVVDAYRESFLLSQNTGIATVRAGNIIGGGDWAVERLMPDIIRAFSVGATLTVRNPSATRPWQHVIEPLRGCLLLAQALYADAAEFSTAWNFGPSREDQRPVLWLIEYCARQWGEKARWNIEPQAKIYEAQRLGLTSSKAELRLGWKPLWPLETALDRTLDWYRVSLTGRDMLEHTRAQVSAALFDRPERMLRSAE